MYLEKQLRSFSNQLQRVPFLNRFALRLYGFRSFNPRNTRYKNSNSQELLHSRSKRNYLVVFDAQCLQTLTWQRGIGKYSLRLISAMCRERPDQNFAVFLTTVGAREGLDIAKNLLQGLKCPNLEILIFNPFDENKTINLIEAQVKLGEFLIDIHCNSILNLSVFENPSSTIPLPMSHAYKRIGILYDVIPLQMHRQLLISRRQRTSYMWSLRLLTQYDLLLSISEESKRHWIELVSSSNQIHSIFGAGEPTTKELHMRFEERFGILSVGAEQPHKNLERLIAAYKLLPNEIQVEHNLVLVGIRSPGARRRLLNLARGSHGRVIVPPYLESHELDSLYEKSRILVMPSLVEGLSLPILEAWSHGLVAVGSANTVAEELIRDQQLLFDPHHASSMSVTIQNVLSSKSNWESASENAVKRSQLITWSITARRALSAIDAVTNG